jgi:hypothetical protein
MIIPRLFANSVVAAFCRAIGSARLAVFSGLFVASSLAALGQNFLVNGSFTSTDGNGDPTNWWLEDAGIVSIDTADFPSGASRSLRIDLPVNQGSSLGQVRQSLSVAASGAPLLPNTGYLARIWVKSTSAGQTRLQVKRYDASNVELERIDSSSSGTGWSQIQVGFNTGAAARIEVLLRYRKDSMVSGQVARFAAGELLDGSGSTLGTLTLVPTFASIGVYAPVNGALVPGANGHSLELAYRPTGTSTWIPALPAAASVTDNEFRGSLLLLQPNTSYDVQATLKTNGTTLDQETAVVSTWSESETIASDTTLPSSTTSTYTITAQGTANGWVRYKAAGGGSTVAVSAATDYAVYINNAAYVVIDGLTLKGGRKATVYINNSRHIRIRNCDISGWSEAGTFGANVNSGAEVPYGYFTAAPFDNTTLINLRAGVYVTGAGSSQIVVERNLIHHPIGKAASWVYDDGTNHPAGPSGIILHGTGGNHVIRDNDIVPGAGHYFNDVIESKENGQDTGGPYRDTDISGNLLADANDDGTELDGGQMNVRFWHNWVEGNNSALSTAPNRKGPSYVFRNLFVGGDERGTAKAGFKLGGQPGVVHFINNTIYTQGYGLVAGNYGSVATPIFSRNNLFAGPVAGTGFLRFDNDTWSVYGDIDYDLYPTGGINSDVSGWEPNGVAGEPDFSNASARSFLLLPNSPGVATAAAVAGLAAAGDDVGAVSVATSADGWPMRAASPTVFPLRSVVRLSAGASAVIPLELNAPAAAGATWTATAGETWLSVLPASGSAGSAPQAINCTVDATSLAVGSYRTFVSIRTNTGALRSVLLVVEVEPATSVVFTMEAETGPSQIGFESLPDSSASGGFYEHAVSEGSQTLGAIRHTFTIPTAGNYYVHARVRADGPASALQTQNSFSLHVDNDTDLRWDLAALGTDWSWETARVVPASVTADITGPIYFTAASHYVEIEKREPGAQLDVIVVSNSPFPPRVAMPSFSPGGGAYGSAQSVSLSTATSGATIRYTSDGSTPSRTHGTVYSGAINVSGNTLLKAIAYKDQMEDSPVSAEMYSIDGSGGGGSGAFQMSANEVVIEAEHFSTETSGDSHDWTLYTQSSASGASTDNAIRAMPNTGTGYPSFNAAATRVDYAIDVPSGSASSFYVHLRHLGPTTADDSVYLSIDGGTTSVVQMELYPTLSWRTSASTLAIPAGQHVLTIWMREDGAIIDKIVVNNSATTPTGSGPAESARNDQAEAPVFSPSAGTYATAQPVTISSGTSGATIRYTTDGSTPNATTGTVYGGAIALNTTTTLKAIAYKSGLTDSAVTSGTYTIQAFQPDTNGQFVMEAEHYTSTSASTDTWTLVTDANAVGGAADNAIQTLPNDGTAYATFNSAAARVDYLVAAPSAGNYYVHLRDYGATSSDDSVYVSIDGGSTTQVVTAGRTLDWKTSPGTLSIPAGLHTVTIWNREDGIEIDRIVVSASSTPPSGNGPAESVRN